MPSPHNRTKMTGDTHLPDTESELSVEDRWQEDEPPAGMAGDRGKAAAPAGRSAGKESRNGSRRRVSGKRRDAGDMPG